MLKDAIEIEIKKHRLEKKKFQWVVFCKERYNEIFFNSDYETMIIL
jgi:hypothetical protein